MYNYMLSNQNFFVLLEEGECEKCLEIWQTSDNLDSITPLSLFVIGGIKIPLLNPIRMRLNLGKAGFHEEIYFQTETPLEPSGKRKWLYKG